MATITEDYVNFEISKLLREKGFDEPCNAYWFHMINAKPIFNDNMLRQVYNNKSDTIEIIGCPTLQMAMKWLRETYNIHIVLSPNKKMNNQYCSIIFVDKEGELHPQPTDFFHGSYEEAAENAIKNCLENLI